MWHILLSLWLDCLLVFDDSTSPVFHEYPMLANSHIFFISTYNKDKELWPQYVLGKTFFFDTCQCSLVNKLRNCDIMVAFSFLFSCYLLSDIYADTNISELVSDTSAWVVYQSSSKCDFYILAIKVNWALLQPWRWKPLKGSPTLGPGLPLVKQRVTLSQRNESLY